MTNDQKRELAKQAMADKLLSVGQAEYQEWLLDIFFGMPEEAVNAKLLEYAQMKKQALEATKQSVQNDHANAVNQIDEGISQMDGVIGELGDA